MSILRPLKGLDPNLYENLESTFLQEYPNYEIFLAVESEHDQALPVVRELMAKYPNVDARVVIGVYRIQATVTLVCSLVDAEQARTMSVSTPR